MSLVAPIVFDGLTSADDGNPTLEDAAQSDDGLVTFLAREPSHEGWQDHIGRVGLLVGASRTGFGMPINLPISAYSLHLAAGVGDVLWIGGVKRAAVTIVSTHISTAYLAKIDRQGRVIWEREYGDMTTQRSIQSVASLPSGNVIVSGQDSKRTWIALISHNGEIIWEHFVGIGKGAALTASDGAVTLAALDVCQCDDGYREDVVVWSFDVAGELLERRTVREGLNKNPREYASDIRINGGSGSIYVLSAWAAFDAQQLEVVCLTSKLDVVWSKSFPKSVWSRGSLTISHAPRSVVLSNGDLLFAIREQQLGESDFVLSRLNASTGSLSEVWVRMPPNPPPACFPRWAAVMFLKEEPQASVLLLGGPPAVKGAVACGWIGETGLPNSQH